jgi:hypothetical protein
MLAALAAAALPAPAHAQANEQWSVTPPSGSSTQRFGFALARDGDTMVVGAPYNDTNGTDSGTAWIYAFDAATTSWQPVQQLFASDPQNSSHFGWSVAIRGDLVVVGAPHKDTTIGTDGGQAYVFRYDAVAGSWVEEQKLQQSTGSASDDLGISVAVAGDVVLAGTPNADTSAGTNSGAVFVFRYKGATLKWVEETELVDPDGKASDLAGTSVDWDGSFAVVASPNSNESSKGLAGSVGIWTESAGTWTQVQELTAPSPQTSAEFGTRVRLQGDLLGVTAPLEDESAAAVNSGAAYLFRLVSGSFVFETRFAGPAPVTNLRFGSDIALSDDLIVVGAQYDDVAGKADSGAAHLFRLSKKLGWVYDTQLSASDRANSDHLGSQVLLHPSMILAAADGNDTGSGADFGVIDGYAPAEMTMTIDPPQPAAGQLVTFSAFRGDPNALCMVTIEDVGGAFVFIPVLIYNFATDHALTFTANAPNPLYGVSVGMRAYKMSPTGPLVRSGLVYVDV